MNETLRGAYRCINEGITADGTSLTADQCTALQAELDYLRKVDELSRAVMETPLLRTLQRLLDRVHGTQKE